MKQHPTRTGRSLMLLAAAVFCACAAGSVRAQRMGTHDRELGSRSAELSDLERSTQRKKRTPQEVLAEVNEDMRQLQTLHDTIAHAAAQPLNYKLIAESTAEIKKRSLRLRTDLALPEVAKDEKQAERKDAGNDLPPALDTLNKMFDAFLHNPIFSDMGAVDQQLAAKARRDLEGIITLSDKVRKNADKMSKSGDKP